MTPAVSVTGLRFLLDTNILDAIIASSLHNRLYQLSEDGKIQLLFTHHQTDEIEAIRNPQKREKREQITVFLSHCSRVPTSGFVCGISKLGAASPVGLWSWDTANSPPQPYP